MRLGTPGVKIGVFPSTAFEERRAFFCVLGEALNLTFEARDSRDYDNLSGLFLFSDSQSDLETCRESGLSVLQFSISGPQQSAPTKTVKFATSGAIHASFRGQTFSDESLTMFCPLKLGQEILAWIEGFPVWTREQVGKQSLHTFGIDLPPCGPDGFFYQFFQYTSWFRVVPLLTFLKDCVPVSYWLEAEARASIIVDDPNLHRSDYGFIDFRNLVRHADQHNYHIAIAAIPLDMWYTDAAAAAIFRNHPERLSLIFHGIDHTLHELAQDCSDETALAILAAGLKRVERFERKSGLSGGARDDCTSRRVCGTFCQSHDTSSLRGCLRFPTLAVELESSTALACGYGFELCSSDGDVAAGLPSLRASGYPTVFLLGTSDYRYVTSSGLR